MVQFKVFICLLETLPLFNFNLTVEFVLYGILFRAESLERIVI